MARKGSRATGSLARNLAIACAVAGLVGGLLLTVGVVQNVSGSIGDADEVQKAW